MYVDSATDKEWARCMCVSSRYPRSRMYSPSPRTSVLITLLADVRGDLTDERHVFFATRGGVAWSVAAGALQIPVAIHCDAFPVWRLEYLWPWKTGIASSRHSDCTPHPTPASVSEFARGAPIPYFRSDPLQMTFPISIDTDHYLHWIASSKSKFLYSPYSGDIETYNFHNMICKERNTKNKNICPSILYPFQWDSSCTDRAVEYASGLRLPTLFFSLFKVDFSHGWCVICRVLHKQESANNFLGSIHLLHSRSSEHFLCRVFCFEHFLVFVSTNLKPFPCTASFLSRGVPSLIFQ